MREVNPLSSKEPTIQAITCKALKTVIYFHEHPAPQDLIDLIKMLIKVTCPEE